MRKVTDIFYLEPHERSSDYSRGLLLILDDGSKLELMSTDLIADSLKDYSLESLKKGVGK